MRRLRIHINGLVLKIMTYSSESIDMGFKNGVPFDYSPMNELSTPPFSLAVNHPHLSSIVHPIS